MTAKQVFGSLGTIVKQAPRLRRDVLAFPS